MTKIAKSDPLTPSRADYRIMKRILDSSSMKVTHIPEEFDLVSSVFQRAGGSWERVFDGGVGDISLLKKVLKIAYKNHHLTHAPVWK